MSENLRRYNTPEAATLALLKRVYIDGVISEPCVGERCISDVLQRHLDAQPFDDRHIPERRIITNDLDTQVAAQFHLDATLRATWERFGQHDWSVSNPEFNIAGELLPLALDSVRLGVAMMLRVTWLEPADDRADFLSTYPPQQLIVLPRISFKTVITTDHRGKERKSTSDSATVAWYVWYKFPVQVPRPIDVVTKAELRSYEVEAAPLRQIVRPANHTLFS